LRHLCAAFARRSTLKSDLTGVSWIEAAIFLLVIVGAINASKQPTRNAVVALI
jgi:hypothetical protein